MDDDVKDKPERELPEHIKRMAAKMERLAAIVAAGQAPHVKK